METKKVELKNCEIITNSNEGGRKLIPFEIGEKVNVEFTEVLEEKLVENEEGEEVLKKVVVDVKDKKINGKNIDDWIVHLRDKTVYAY